MSSLAITTDRDETGLRTPSNLNAPTLDPQLARLLAQVAAETERRAGGMPLLQEAEPRGISRSRADFEDTDSQIQGGGGSINILEQGHVLKRFKPLSPESEADFDRFIHVSASNTYCSGHSDSGLVRLLTLSNMCSKHTL